MATIDEFFDLDAPILRRRGDLKLSILEDASWDADNVRDLGIKGKAMTLVVELEVESYVPAGSTVELSIPKSNRNYYEQNNARTWSSAAN